MTITALSAEGLTVAEGGAVVISDLHLHARGGAMLGIAGPSGSGKTTLLYALSGLTQAVEGQVLAEDRPVVLWREVSVGFIFQNLALAPLLSAQETVALPLQARGISKEEVATRSANALEALGLGEHMAQLVGDLSGGQRQRVAVARALAATPDVILADEPTSALDQHWRGVVLDLLAAEASRGAVVIVASTDGEISSLCDQVLTLE